MIRLSQGWAWIELDPADQLIEVLTPEWGVEMIARFDGTLDIGRGIAVRIERPSRSGTNDEEGEGEDRPDGDHRCE